MRPINPGGHKERIGLFLGPVLALGLLLFIDLDPANAAVTPTAAVAVLMAVWWITEAIPIPATALLPVALFPLLGIMDGRAVAGTYFNSVILLFLGGFMMALAMERWGLHRRIALKVFLTIGAGPRRLVLGFMVATAFLSMWISNTATTMMMVPIALAVVASIRESTDEQVSNRFAVGLLLGIAYAASIGGIATLIGTPPNLSFARIFSIYFPEAPEISFAQWFVFGLPVSILFLAICWTLLTFMFRAPITDTSDRLSTFRQAYKKLGPMSTGEKAVAILFSIMALLWLSRTGIAVGGTVIPGWASLLATPGFVDDGTVAIAVALLLFIVPADLDGKRARLLNWATAARLPWGIVLLFGGGFALASGFKESGLSEWIAGQLTGLSGVPSGVLVASVCFTLTFLTELTSNTATTEMVLPLLGSLSVAIKSNPLMLMIPATLSASFAFMLPVATPPNAIVFASGVVKMSDMVRVGIILNLIGIVLVTVALFALGTAIFDIDPTVLPSWAN